MQYIKKVFNLIKVKDIILYIYHLNNAHFTLLFIRMITLFFFYIVIVCLIFYKRNQVFAYKLKEDQFYGSVILKIHINYYLFTYNYMVFLIKYNEDCF